MTSDDGALSHTSCLARLHEFEVDASIEGPAAEIQDACRKACSLETARSTPNSTTCSIRRARVRCGPIPCSGDPSAMACRSADVAPHGSETSSEEAVLHPLSRYAGLLAAIADQKRALRPERGVFVGVVGGAAPFGGIDPFDVHYARSNDPEHTVAFGVAPGCASERGEAQPPVRMRELVEEFWDGFQEDPLSSICEASYLHALACVPGAYEPPSGCLADCVGDDDPSTPATPSDCTVVERMRDGTDRALPPCLDVEGLGAIPPGEPRGCAIVRTGPDLDCDGANAQVEVVWRVLPDALCVRTVCRRSLHPSLDCPGLDAPPPISWRP